MNPQRYALLRSDIRRLYLSGETLQAIGSEFGINPGSVRRVLLRAGITLRPRGWKGSSCMECGKPTKLSLRCSFHERIHIRSLQRTHWRRKHSVSRKLWRVMDV